MRANSRTCRWSFSLLVAAWAVMFVAVLARNSSAAEPVSWLRQDALRSQLAKPISISWTDMPLRRGLGDLAGNLRVAILLDRRVDPDQPLDLAADQVPLTAALRGLAEPRGLGISVYGPVVYIGPPHAAAHLRTLAALLRQRVGDFPPDMQRRWLRKRPVDWNDLTTPGALLDEWSAEGQIELTNRQRIPHDLWPAASLPPLTLVERLVLVAVQFDLTCQPSEDGTSVRFVPIGERVEIRREYPGGRRPEQLAEQWQKQLPDGRVEVADGRIVVHGRVEDHERLHGTPAPTDVAIDANAQRVYTLRVEDVPLDALLRQLETRLSLEIDWDSAALDRAGVTIDQRITLDVNKATLDELLQAALRPAGLVHQRRGNRITVRPAAR